VKKILTTENTEKHGELGFRLFLISLYVSGAFVLFFLKVYCIVVLISK